MEKCEKCEKSKKRYRPAFNSWICDNCKTETEEIMEGCTALSEAMNWWCYLPVKEKVKIYRQNQTPPARTGENHISTNNSI